MTNYITAECSGFGEGCVSWYQGLHDPVPTASPNQSVHCVACENCFGLVAH